MDYKFPVESSLIEAFYRFINFALLANPKVEIDSW
jgi:hypothetical protein